MKNNFPERKPNFLVITVDQERFPPIYETEEIKIWRENFLRGQNFLADNGLSFNNHYIGSTACSPSRTTLYTGQYPSLHGVSQTTGAAKDDFDPDMFWLDPNTVPTMGDYFRVAGYKTYWKGKWHASQPDILIPDTHDSYLSYNADTGVPIPENAEIYLNANKLNEFGFNDWIGPEPFGGNPRNSGSSAAIGLSGRDIVYADEVIELINGLDNNNDDDPWLIMCSFVNPHDIATFGAYTRLYPLFEFTVDPSVPDIPRAPTANELLLTKPMAQRSYQEVYPKALQPLADKEFYRQLYYSLQLTVDRDMQRVLSAITNSPSYNDTIIIFTSDHGELLGAHNMYQKWYQAYQETIHVPLIIHSPNMIVEGTSTEVITSHVDILPTMLGLASIDEDRVANILKKSHTDVRPLVGRNLAPFILGEIEENILDEPVYFMTDDDFTKGLNQVSFLGVPYESVVQPNSVETVVTNLDTGEDNTKELWKYTKYFDNPQFWTTPGCEDNVTITECSKEVCDNVTCSTCITTTKTTPVESEYELYNLTQDPLEEYNLADPEFSTPESITVQRVLEKLLEEQCRLKRLYPTSGPVPGRPLCQDCTPEFSV